MKFKVTVGVSARHAHLTKEVYEQLFGDTNIEKRNDLNQVGEFASSSVVNIKTEKGILENVRVLGPFREYNQIEVSKTDAYKLGVNPPVRASGDLASSTPVTLVGPKGEVSLNEGLIIPERHIHMNELKAQELGLKDGEKVIVVIGGEKIGTIEAFVKISDNGFYEIHLDTDDANAFLLKNNDEVNIICGK